MQKSPCNYLTLTYLWAISPGGQRAHALVDGGTGTGHPCSEFWVRIAGEPGAYAAQSCRRASHITRATIKDKAGTFC